MAQVAKREALAASEDRVLVKEKRAKDEEKDNQAVITISDVTVSQGLSREDILKKLNEQTAKLVSCLAGAKGKIVLRLTISPDGTVKSVQILSSTLKNGKASQCMADQIRKIKLPATPDGKDGRVVISLIA
jgi:Na+-translocating ferredoxin:NAD+ oxidoreductase RnfG subunit